MVITKDILDEQTAMARVSERLLGNLYLRNTSEDQSQYMLNALETESVMPIHWHLGSSETHVCIRGHLKEYLYDEKD